MTVVDEFRSRVRIYVYVCRNRTAAEKKTQTFIHMRADDDDDDDNEISNGCRHTFRYTKKRVCGSSLAREKRNLCVGVGKVNCTCGGHNG